MYCSCDVTKYQVHRTDCSPLEMLLMALCLAVSYQANVFISWSFYLPEHGLLTAQYTSQPHLANNWPAGEKARPVWSPGKHYFAGWAEEGWQGSHDLIFSTIGGNLARLQPGSSQAPVREFVLVLAWRQSETVRERYSALSWAAGAWQVLIYWC